MKRLDFPVKPHILKYLVLHLELSSVESKGQTSLFEDYVLSKSDRFGFALHYLLRRPVKSARHKNSAEDCTEYFGVDLRNFNYPHYGLNNLPSYAVFQFNDYVDELVHAELYEWVKQQVNHRSTIVEAIRSFMAIYDFTEEDIALETLRKSVQRNVDLKVKIKPGKIQKNFSVNLSQKKGGLSQKSDEVSQKTRVLSQKDTFRAVREQLMSMPLPLMDIENFRRGARQ